MDSEESHESAIARGAGFVLVGTVLSTGLGFLIRTFLIRELPTADYGLFALALTTAGALTTVATLGFHQGVARMVSRCETDSEVRDITLTAITSTLVVSLLFSGVLVIFSDFLAETIFREPGLKLFLEIVGALIPGMTIQTVVIATFRGKKRVYERIMVQNLVSPVARFVLIGGAVLLGYGAFGAVVAWTAGILLSTILGLYYLYRRTTTFEIAAFEPRHRSLLAFSLPLMISSTMWTAVQQADNLLLGYYDTSVEVGIYDGTFLLARLLLVVLSSFGFLFMPIFSELEAAGELDRMRDVYNSVTEWAVLLVLPIYVALMFAPEAILTTVFKNAYALGSLPLMLVASGFFVHVLSGSCGDALVALGRTRLVMAGNVGAGILNILLNLALIPRFGITGAAMASASAYALFNLFFLFWLHQETGIIPFTPSFLKPLFIGTAVIASVWIVADRVGGSGLTSLAIVLTLTYLLHAFVVIRTKRMTAGDEQLLTKLDAKLGIDVKGVLSRFR
jgi:O-antigen/teichoic acid export membrane protein